MGIEHQSERMESGHIVQAHEQFKSSSPPTSSSMDANMAAISIPTTTTTDQQNTSEGGSGIISMDTTGTGRTSPPSTNDLTDMNLNLDVTASSSSRTNTNFSPKSVLPVRKSNGTSTSARCSSTRSDAAAHPTSPSHSCPPTTFAIEPANRMMMTRSSNTSRLDTLNCPYTRSSTNFDGLKSEQVRLNTFYGAGVIWPVSFIQPADCAKAGFYFLRDGDKVQCAFCRGVAGEWEEGDVPLNEHRRHFPRCPFISNLPVGNIPIGQEEEAARLHEVNQAAYGYDICGPFEAPPHMSYHGHDQVNVRGAQPLSSDPEDLAISLGIQTKSGPARKNLVTLQARLKTFANWPKSSGQAPEVMAEAGFFYIGTQDHVMCFYCHGGLRNWEKVDDPWFEHARWFSTCPYVLLNKGQDYIKNATKSKPNPAIGSDSSSASTASSSSSRQSSSDISSSEAEASSSEQSSSELNSSSSSDENETSSQEENSSGDEDVSETTVIKAPATRSPSGDSGICTPPNGESFGEEETPAPTACVAKKEAAPLTLEEEIRQLKEARQCKICMDNEVGVVFLPCGHFVSCVRCATALSHCALCRQPIKAVVRTYLS